MEKNYRYNTFGVVIFPPNSESIDFSSKDPVEITSILRDLGFFTPIALAEILASLKVPGNKKRNSSERYFSVVESLHGQLELGSKTNRPHYQICLKFSIKITKKQLLEALSLVLFNQKNSNAVSVMVASEDSSLLEAYCSKETRAHLMDEFADIVLSKEFLILHKFLRENPEAKFFLNGLIAINAG